MGLILALLSPILAILAPFEFVIGTVGDFASPFMEVLSDWINYFAL